MSLTIAAEAFESPSSAQRYKENTAQSGFHSGYGCVTANLKVLHDVIIALDSKQCCAAIFIDLAKAFDTVDHSIFMGRLRRNGVSGECSV